VTTWLRPIIGITGAGAWVTKPRGGERSMNGHTLTPPFDCDYLRSVATRALQENRIDRGPAVTWLSRVSNAEHLPRLIKDAGRVAGTRRQQWADRIRNIALRICPTGADFGLQVDLGGGAAHSSVSAPGSRLPQNTAPVLATVASGSCARYCSSRAWAEHQ